MMSSNKPGICIVPVIDRIAGPGSFQLKLRQELESRGYPVTYDPMDPNIAVILVIAGTRNLGDLRAAKARGVRIVQRLNGINYVHRRRWTGLRHFLRAERGNWLLNYTRKHVADAIVYQSDFTKKWWHDWFGGHKAPYTVIRNGVDPTVYTDEGPETPPEDHIRIQVVEGHLNVDNGPALENAYRFAAELEKAAGKKVELVIASDVNAALRAKIEATVPDVWTNYLGVVPRERIPGLSRTAHMQFSAEINPSCPNSVVEALACGLPVVGYDTGSLAELVQGKSGVVVPYGSDPWKLGTGDTSALALASLEVLRNQSEFRRSARQRAVEVFNLAAMTDAYLSVLLLKR